MEISAEIKQMVTNLGGNWGEWKMTSISWQDNTATLAEVVCVCLYLAKVMFLQVT